MNKRFLSLIAVVVLLASLFAFTTAASANGYYAVYSHCGNGKPLNVREGPGKDYFVISRVPYGEAIYVVGETYPGWLQLNDGGFVQASLTSRTYPGPYVPPTPSPDPKPAEKSTTEKLYEEARFVNPYTITLKATVKSKGVANVRWAPSKTAKLQKAYPAGTRVTVLAELGKNWYQIQDPDTLMVGFVNTAYVE